jgi:hypothetical protein
MHGVVMMAWGENAIREADACIRSLWRHDPDLPVWIVGDTDAVAHFSVWQNVNAHTIDVDPFDGTKRKGQKFLAGRVKPLLCELVPVEWERVLYVDVDSEFVTSPQRGFDLLDRWDFVIAEARGATVATAPFRPVERHETAAWLGADDHIYHNSGMLFWRRCPAVFELMQLWSEEWARYGDWDEQIALLRALLRSEALFLTVPYTWNTLRDATLLQHAYGTHAARIEARGRAPHDTVRTARGGVRTFEQLLTPQQRKQTARPVEVSPGVVVRLHGDDTEQVRARLVEIVGEEL